MDAETESLKFPPVEKEKSEHTLFIEERLEEKSKELSVALSENRAHEFKQNKIDMIINPTPTGIEKLVCDDIAKRQEHGKKKYGVEVDSNPLTEIQWLQHAYEEALDLAVYLKKIMEEKKKLEIK